MPQRETPGRVFRILLGVGEAAGFLRIVGRLGRTRLGWASFGRSAAYRRRSIATMSCLSANSGIYAIAY